MEEIENGIENEPKKYLYHMVPQDLAGTVLHPLNRLKESHPELYISKASKYTGREHVMEKFIPTLGCKWNDVLQFSPIHPAELKEALIEAGMKPHEMKFFQIDPELLDPAKTTVYLYNNTDFEHFEKDDNFALYDPDNIATHSVVRDITKQFWKERIEAGERPLLFVGVPHILHKGSIDVSELPVITV